MSTDFLLGFWSGWGSPGNIRAYAFQRVKQAYRVAFCCFPGSYDFQALDSVEVNSTHQPTMSSIEIDMCGHAQLDHSLIEWKARVKVCEILKTSKSQSSWFHLQYFIVGFDVHSSLNEIAKMAMLGLISWSLFVDACRLLSVCFFLITSLSLNWYSFLSIIALLGEWGPLCVYNGFSLFFSLFLRLLCVGTNFSEF